MGLSANPASNNSILGFVSRKSQELFWPEMPVVKIPSTCFDKGYLLTCFFFVFVFVFFFLKNQEDCEVWHSKRFGAFAKQALWSMFTPRIYWLFEAHVMRYNMRVCTTCDSLHLVPVECNRSGRAVSMCKSKSPFHILLSGFCFLFWLFFSLYSYFSSS